MKKFKLFISILLGALCLPCVCFAFSGCGSASSGTLVITYSYEGAVSKTLTVTIERAENTTGALLDMRNADVLENVNTNDVAGSRVRYDADQNYLVWESAVGSSTEWRRLYVNFGTTNADLIQKGISYVQKALEIAPGNIAYLDSLAWGYYKQKHCKRAKEVFAKIPKESLSSDEELLKHAKSLDLCQ